MPPAEPTLALYTQLGLRYFAATRPAFLTVTFVGSLLGLACAASNGTVINSTPTFITFLFALVAHAGANVLNDYYDARSGCDAANHSRLFPFTGGSRFIQNGVLSVPATGAFGYLLLASVIPAGGYLMAVSSPALIIIGILGLLCGWAYSAPPLKLQARGLGEFGVTAGWLLVVVGADFVARCEFSFVPVAAGLGYALLVANVLYINQFPDVAADAGAGKRTVVARLGLRSARWGYVVIAALALVWLVFMCWQGWLPRLALFSLLPLILSVYAGGLLWSAAAQDELDSAQFLTPIKLTILAAVSHGILLAAALIVSVDI